MAFCLPLVDPTVISEIRSGLNAWGGESFGLPLFKRQSTAVSPCQTHLLNTQDYRTLALPMKTMHSPLTHMSQSPSNRHMSTALASVYFPSSSFVSAVSLQKPLFLLLCFNTFLYSKPQFPFFLIYPQKEWPQIYIYWNWYAHSCWKGTCAIILHDENLHLGRDFCILFDDLSQGLTQFMQTHIWLGGVFSLGKSDEESTQ